MSAAERGTCGKCETGGIRLTPRPKQLLYKHDTPAGDPCPGGGQAPVTEVVDEQPPANEQDDWLIDDEAEAPPVKQPKVAQPEPEPAKAEHPKPPAEPAKDTYEWQMTIRQPALYLDDAAWHHGNAIMAGRAAEQAGHTPRTEATCSGVVSTEDGSGLVLTYTVPIEGGPRG